MMASQFASGDSNKLVGKKKYKKNLYKRILARKSAPSSNSLPALTFMSEKGDRLFSRTSLRCITAANIREKERLIHIFRNIDKAVRTNEAEFEHSKKEMDEKRAWLQSKLREKNWRRLMNQSHAYQRTAAGMNNFISYRDSYLPSVTIDATHDGPNTSTTQGMGSGDALFNRRSVPLASQLEAYGDTRYAGILDQTNDQLAQYERPPLTLDDIQQLVHRLHNMDPISPNPEPMTSDERLVFDFLMRMAAAVERDMGVSGLTSRRSNNSTMDKEILRRLGQALGVDLSALAQQSSESSDVLDKKRQKYLERMNVSPVLLPPLHSAKSTKIVSRSWDISESTPHPPKITNKDWVELTYCRYLRQGGGLRTSGESRDDLNNIFE